MPITFKRAGQEAVALENVSFKGVALDKVTFKRAGHEAVTVFEKATEDALAGTWVMKDSVKLMTGANSFSINFISKGIEYKTFTMISTFGGSINYTDLSDSALKVYSQNAWTDPAYKTITITSKLSEVTNGDTILAWLQANATKQ